MGSSEHELSPLRNREIGNLGFLRFPDLKFCEFGGDFGKTNCSLVKRGGWGLWRDNLVWFGVVSSP